MNPGRHPRWVFYLLWVAVILGAVGYLWERISAAL